MADERTMDLSVLGDVTPPDVVRGALRRFRRRVFTTGAVVAAAALSLAGAILWATVLQRTLAEEIEDAPGAYVGAVFSEGDAFTVLERVARLDDGVGLHLHLVTPDAPPRAHFAFRMPGVRNFEMTSSGKVHDLYYVIAPRSEPIETVLTLDTPCEPGERKGLDCGRRVIHRLTIDLDAWKVPDELWKE